MNLEQTKAIMEWVTQNQTLIISFAGALAAIVGAIYQTIKRGHAETAAETLAQGIQDARKWTKPELRTAETARNLVKYRIDKGLIPKGAIKAAWSAVAKSKGIDPKKYIANGGKK